MTETQNDIKNYAFIIGSDVRVIRRLLEGIVVGAAADLVEERLNSIAGNAQRIRKLAVSHKATLRSDIFGEDKTYGYKCECGYMQLGFSTWRDARLMGALHEWDPEGEQTENAAMLKAREIELEMGE